MYAIYDLAYATSLPLPNQLKLKAETVKAMHQERWRLSKSLSIKQIMGDHCQFVLADESIQRPPQLPLKVGTNLSYLDAVARAAPAGFLVCLLRRTSEALSVFFIDKPFPQSYHLPNQFRKMESVTENLLKGVLAKRCKSVNSASISAT